MDVELQARHMELSESVRDYVNRKVGGLDHHLQDIKAIRVDLDHGVRRSRGKIYTAQITTWVDGTILRAEEMDQDLFAAIDKASDKLDRQIQRFKGKRLDRWHEHTRLVPDEPPEVALAEESEAAGHIVRRKRFGMLAMDEAEAIEQLDLLGHDFFVFMNAETGQVNVIYHRKDGNYGLIQPELA